MNKIILAGLVAENPTFSHEVYGEKFYIFHLSSSRKSGTQDVLPCIVSEILKKNIEAGTEVKICGNIRTRNVHKDDKIHLEITVFVKEVLAYEEDENYVVLDGFICKDPTYRELPFGRKVTDLIVANNRPYTGKSDYIPTIAWGRMEIKSSEFEVGTRVKIFGRLQSREYVKRLDDGTEETRVAYELSANRVDVVEESEGEE